MTRKATGPAGAEWAFEAFVIDRSAAHSERAIAELRMALDHHLRDRYHLEVIDLREHPERAAPEQLLVLPAVIRRRPQPELRLTGSFADEARIARAFGFPPPG